MIITRAPFRVSFCGGGSDLPSFYEKYGGEYRYPTNQMSYPIEDKKKAYATYRRYKKKCMR